MTKLNNIPTDWIIGFVWGVGTISGSRLYIRYHDEELLLRITESINTKARPYHPTEGKTAIRFNLNHPFSQRLLSLGWSGRFDKDRKYPQGEFNELEFIQGYCYTKSTIGLWHGKNRRGERIKGPRLRVFGSCDIVFNIDQYFVNTLQTSPKKSHIHKGRTQDGYSGECYCVQYASKKEVPLILKLIERMTP